MKQTVVINLIGAPGTGKSTLAAHIFSTMKMQGFDVELVVEYAKELVWEQRNDTMKNELYLFAKQHHRMFRLRGKVDFIITDRPLILSQHYNSVYGDNSKEFKNIVLHEVRKYNNVDIFLERTHKYVQQGRVQTEEESVEFERQMLKLAIETSTNLQILHAEIESSVAIMTAACNAHAELTHNYTEGDESQQ